MAMQSCISYSQCNAVTLISSNSHLGIVHRIEATLFSQPPPRPKLTPMLVEELKQHNDFNGACLIVALGAQALEAVLKSKTSVPTLSVLTRKNTFHQLIKTVNLTLHDADHPISAIYLDQPLKRQFQLLERIIPKELQSPVGVLLGGESIDEQENLQQVAKELNLNLLTVFVSKDENPVAVLDELLTEAEVVLALPDNHIYTPNTTRGILLTAYHQRVPLIGYSRAYMQNGALATVYSSNKQIAEQTVQEIMAFIQQKQPQLPPPQYPKEFAVGVNYQVARSLGLHIESETAIKTAMNNMEKENL
ncbi:MAG: ABC transporter substrate-binding protein [Candidatus Berkiellales bacterium]